MTTIHMETEKVRAVGKKLDTDGAQMLSSLSQTQSAASRLNYAWLGGSAEDFNHDLNRLVKKIENHIAAVQSLSVRVTREVDEWESADQIGAKQYKADQSKWEKNKEASRRIFDAHIDKDTEYILVRGYEFRAYEGYLAGDLTFEEAAEFIGKEPLENDYLKSSITFYKHEEAGKLALLDGQLATKYGDFTSSLGSIEGRAESKVHYQDGAFRADGSLQAGIYAAKGTYSAEVAGLSVAAVGYLGAAAQAEGGLAFDPAKGEVGGKVEVEAFVGGKLEGSVSKKGSVAGIEGEVTATGGVSYGIGATAKVDAGFSQGHLRAEVELGATLGLGAEFSIGFDLNVQQAAENTVEAAKNAVDWLFNP
jgi:uncharacterized protein YukE